MNGIGDRCGTCGRKEYHRVYGRTADRYVLCTECGSSLPKADGGASDQLHLIIDKPFVDMNIDGTPHYITSRRKHKDLLKEHNLVCRHYM